MDSIADPVKAVRRYDSPRRRQQALATRNAVLDVAERLFLEQGDGATTIASIAQDASVSVETIYKGFGGKAGLVRGLWQRGLEGSGPIPAEQRSAEIHDREQDPRAVILAWSRFMIEVAPLATPILLWMRAAAVM